MKLAVQENHSRLPQSVVGVMTLVPKEVLMVSRKDLSGKQSNEKKKMD